MLNKFKKFKFCKRQGSNLLSSVKLANVFYKNFLRRRWLTIRKSSRSVSNLYPVSRYFAKNRMEKGRLFFLFFKRQTAFYKDLSFSLDILLIAAMFFKNLREARFFILNGFVLIDGFTSKKPNTRVKPGSIVSIKLHLLDRFKASWKSSCFFTKHAAGLFIFSSMPSYFEVSYSTGSFCLVHANTSSF